MPKPREVFDVPEQFWHFLTAPSDPEFEDQFFDRKEAGFNGTISKSQLSELLEQIKGCVSAFSNANRDGGLLVIGISSTGEFKSIDHLTDEQRNAMANVNQLLRNQAAEVKLIDYADQSGNSKKVCFIFASYIRDAICETPGAHPKAWMRKGPQNLLMDDIQREQLRRDKKIVEYERAYCCPYDPALVDRAVLEEFRKVFLSDARYEYSDEELLYNAGAIEKDGDSYYFTRIGFLFFAANPQRVMPWAFIRLLRYERNSAQEGGLPTFEKKFGGPITKQIRDVRTFFQESGFFKTYSRRNREASGFIDEPEYPQIAVDEAIVNAVVHRDYAVHIPIECESYKDAFVVRNSGRIIQRDFDVPSYFSLKDTRLFPTPRNPQLIEWLKTMIDSQGKAFVKALAEGTRAMKEEMLNLSLPAPEYRISDAQTHVILFSKAAEREALIQAELSLIAHEFANFFPLYISLDSAVDTSTTDGRQLEREIISTLKDTLVAHGWYADRAKFGRLTAHQQGANIQLRRDVDRLIRFYPAYEFQLRQYFEKRYLCIDYTLEVKNICSVDKLLNVFQLTELIDKTAVAQWNGWYLGRITTVDREFSSIYLFDYEQEVQIPSGKIIPNLSKSLIKQLLSIQNIQFDLPKAIKQHSLSLEPNAARVRAEKTQMIATHLAQTIFPLSISGGQVILQPTPATLLRQGVVGSDLIVRPLLEPNVVFSHHHAVPDIRDGITRYGSYDQERKTIEIVPICTPELRSNMANLIERLKSGKYKYRGSERTFSTRFIRNSIITVPSPEQILDECKRLLDEHPEWIGNEQLNRIFLVHAPEKGYVSDDEDAPYYQVKRFLFERGIPCQMVDTPILHNPDWKDLNLALNITAKCGIVPWVLPDALPDADFFIGLSYTKSRKQGAERLMGYANIFNEYGRWLFYSGNMETFSYEQRIQYFQNLVEQTLERLNLHETPHIYFHYSAKFSREDRAAILKAARRVRPQGTYSFVWINSHHNVRLYDNRAETDGSLSRGSYVVASSNQIYLSTTGYNPYRKTLGTPQPLEINIWTIFPDNMPKSAPDLRALAVQILSLTKLNWASTDSLCAEPITTKYAGDIAYLTDAFLRQGQPFKLHKALEKTPWFL